MKTITSEEYIYNPETGTTTQARVIPLFEFFELNDGAKNHVVMDYMNERENDPYFNQYFYDCYESEIWECVRDLEQSITGARVQWQYNRWYSCDFDCEFSYDDCYDPGYIEPVKDTGYYASMDLCDAWNAHRRKLNALYYRVYYLDTLIYGDYDVWDVFSQYHKENEPFYNRLETMRDDLISQWFEELENACDDVRDTIETLLRGEWEYYTSEEYARMECEDETTQGGKSYACEYPYYKNGGYTGRIYYSDSRKWYTADGEFYEQSNIDHECVSIVKVS